jgi:hypothetical protein
MEWQERVAQEHFDDFHDAAVKNGPQILLRDGVEIAILVSFEEWNRANRQSESTKPREKR